MQLTKAQRNDIFRALVAGGLDPADCELDVGAGSSAGLRTSVISLTHKATGSTWTATTMPFINGKYNVNTKIGSDPARLLPASYDWTRLVNQIQPWAEAVVEWADIPDLWELRLGWQSLADQRYEDTSNTPFTPEEQRLISAQLTAIRESIDKTYELTAEQGAKIDAKFDELDKAAKRLGRKDWTLLFLGGIFSLMLAQVVPADVTMHILTMTMHGLEHLFTAAPRSIEAE